MDKTRKGWFLPTLFCPWKRWVNCTLLRHPLSWTGSDRQSPSNMLFFPQRLISTCCNLLKASFLPGLGTWFNRPLDLDLVRINLASSAGARQVNIPQLIVPHCFLGYLWYFLWQYGTLSLLLFPLLQPSLIWLLATRQGIKHMNWGTHDVHKRISFSPSFATEIKGTLSIIMQCKMFETASLKSTLKVSKQGQLERSLA